jgi:ATP-binding cassette, subfamily B, multidrug efflux pump
MSFVAKLQWFFRQRWAYYLLAIVLFIITSIMNVIPPKLIGDTVDRIRLFEMSGSELLTIVGMLAGIALVAYVLNVLWITTLFGNSILLEKRLRSRLMAHMTRLTPTFFQKNRTGDLMALATNDVPAVSNTAGYGLLTLLSTVTGTTVVVITMSTLISVKLMLAALLPMPLLALAISRLGKQMRKRFLASQSAFGQLNDHVLESVSGLRVVRSYVQEKNDLEAFRKVTLDVLDKNKRVALIGASFEPVISTIVGLSFTIGIGYGTYLVFHDEISLGQLVSFHMYLGSLIWPMISFGEFINVLQRGNASADRLQAAFDQQADVQEPSNPAVIASPSSIVMDNLHFTYPGAANPSLRGISLRVQQGQTLGIVGRTGGGKSTLLKQLLRQYPIEPGALRIADVSIDQLSIDQLRSWIGYVPQEHMLLSKTIAENIRFGNPKADVNELRRAVRLAFLERDIDNMKEGLETLIGENGVMLSGGQKQRVGIARALLANPEILILDDALSAVDARTEHAILENIRRERDGKTTLIATHRLSAVSHAGWIIVLDDGRIVEEGSHADLMQLGGWYKEQFEIQQMEELLESRLMDSEDTLKERTEVS